MSAHGVSPERRRHANSIKVFFGAWHAVALFSPEITLCTKTEWPLRGRGLSSSLCRAYAARSMLLPTAESGITAMLLDEAYLPKKICRNSALSFLYSSAVGLSIKMLLAATLSASLTGG